MNDLQSTLEWYLLSGVDETAGDEVYRIGAEVVKHQLEPAQVPAAAAGARPATTDLAKSSLVALKSARDICENTKTLIDLKKLMSDFEGCALKLTATNLVFGSGNETAKVLIVGEAPGADEDRVGLPFVGRSGQLLEKMLEAIGLKREEVFITNILPWRPPGNRAPTSSEISVCLPFVKKQIDMVDPEIILILGGSAANALLDNGEPISKLRGKWLSYKKANGKNAEVLASFHPAFLLRSGAQKARAWSDFLRLYKKLNES